MLASEIIVESSTPWCRVGGRMDWEGNMVAAKDGRRFEVHCKAGDAGQSCIGTALSVRVSQRVRRHGREEMWDSVGVYAQEEQDGTLVVRVLVFNPDWDERSKSRAFGRALAM